MKAYEVESGVRAFIHFQEKHLLPDAFVCANENIAVGLCHQAQQEGFKIPADFCVTGFDNFDKASYYRPRITTVSYEREKSLLRQPWIFWYRSGGRIKQLTVKRFLYKCCFRIVVAVNQNR